VNEQLLINLIKALSKGNENQLGPCDSDPVWSVGEWYLIRTVTMIDVGRLVKVTDKELVLADASWIADTGRFSECLLDPDVINESEPFANNCIVSRGAICDATKWHNQSIPKK